MFSTQDDFWYWKVCHRTSSTEIKFTLLQYQPFLHTSWKQSPSSTPTTDTKREYSQSGTPFLHTNWKQSPSSTPAIWHQVWVRSEWNTCCTPPHQSQHCSYANSTLSRNHTTDPLLVHRVYQIISPWQHCSNYTPGRETLFVILETQERRSGYTSPMCWLKCINNHMHSQWGNFVP